MTMFIETGSYFLKDKSKLVFVLSRFTYFNYYRPSVSKFIIMKYATETCMAKPVACDEFRNSPRLFRVKMK